MWIKINPNLQVVKGKVSVVIPVHWVKREWLIRAITSVLEQDYHNQEVIVVNDITSENIDDIVESFKIKKYIKNPTNKKLPYSMNRGFEAADGEYFFYLGADDYALPGMFTRLVAELEKDKTYSLVIGRVLEIDENDKPKGPDPQGYSLENQRTAKKAGTDITNPTIERKVTFFGTFDACFLYRREVWEQTGGYDETAIGTEDYDFWIRASRKFKIRRIPDEEPPYSVYRSHSNTISSTGGLWYYCTTARIPILEREAKLYPKDKDIQRAIKYHNSLINPPLRKKLSPFAKKVLNKLKSEVHR